MLLSPLWELEMSMTLLCTSCLFISDKKLKNLQYKTD